MRTKRGRAAVALIAVLAVGGCEQRVREADADPPKSAAPPTQPAAAQPAEPVVAAAEPAPAVLPQTKPAEPPMPVLSFLMIDGLGAHFPPTKLLLHEDDGRIRAELFSDLPRSAIQHYDGNELYLEIDLEGAEPKQLDGASWRYKSMSSDRADSVNGIFLNGQRRHLQPDDVLVKFERRGDQLLARIIGQFRAYEPGTPDALAPFVGVRGEVPVEVVEKR